MSAPRLERDARGRLLLRSTCCPLPHGEVVGRKLRITSPHDKEKHPVELTPEVLREMADQLEREGGATWVVGR